MNKIQGFIKRIQTAMQFISFTAITMLFVSQYGLHDSIIDWAFIGAMSILVAIMLLGIQHVLVGFGAVMLQLPYWGLKGKIVDVTNLIHENIVTYSFLIGWATLVSVALMAWFGSIILEQTVKTPEALGVYTISAIVAVVVAKIIAVDLETVVNQK